MIDRATDAGKKYRIRALLFMSGYVAVNVAAIFGAFDDVRGAGAWALALVVAAPVVGHIWAFLVYIRDSDEFMRGVMAKRFIVAAGIAIALVSTWGFLEVYAHASHAPGFLVYPLFWLAMGLVSPLIRTSH
jgi:hypothetical protein